MVGSQIECQRRDNGSVLPEETYYLIAEGVQKSADVTGLVVVINVQRPAAQSAVATIQSTNVAAGGGHQPVVLRWSKPVPLI